MTEADIRAQVLAVIDGDKNEALAKKAVANLVASAVHNLQRIAEASERIAKALEPRVADAEAPPKG